MGRDGGLAGADGSSARGRAMGAMARHTGEAIGRAFGGLVDAIGLGEEEGPTVAERVSQIRDLDKQTTEKDIAGMVLGDRNASLEGAINAEASPGVVGRIASTAMSLTGLPGLLGGMAVDSAAKANNASNTIGQLNNSGMTMNDGFGHSMGTQARGAVAGGIVSQVGRGIAGPIGAQLAGPAGAVMGSRAASAIGDAASSTAMTGEMSPSPSMDAGPAGRGSAGGGQPARSGRGTPGAARSAMSPAAQTAQSFEWNPVDLQQYSRGLLSLARSS